MEGVLQTNIDRMVKKYANRLQRINRIAQEYLNTSSPIKNKDNEIRSKQKLLFELNLCFEGAILTCLEKELRFLARN